MCPSKKSLKLFLTQAPCLAPSVGVLLLVEREQKKNPCGRHLITKNIVNSLALSFCVYICVCSLDTVETTC